jgi:hypothetical protein
LEWLFDVERVFDLPCHGLTVIANLETGTFTAENSRMKVQDELSVICPNGDLVKTFIKSFPMINICQEHKWLAFEIPKNEQTQRIAKGAQVFRLRKSVEE